LLITPVDCQLGAFTKTPVPLPSLANTGDTAGVLSFVRPALLASFSSRLGLLIPSGVSTLPSLRDEPPFMLFLGCLRVMPPRSFLISSTLCTPSAGFGFFGLIYRSRWRPSEEEVKAWPQKGHALSLALLAAASWSCSRLLLASEEGLDAAVASFATSPSSAMALSRCCAMEGCCLRVIMLCRWLLRCFDARPRLCRGTF
jgi:hypothetical protein